MPPPPTLTSIPADVIRKIFEMDITFVDQMKLISPQWNALAEECLSEMKMNRRMPAIRFFSMKMQNEYLELKLMIPHGHSTYFGVNKWTAQHVWNEIFEFSSSSQLDILGDELARKLSRIFRRSSRVKVLKLINLRLHPYLREILRIALSDVEIGTMSIAKEYFHDPVEGILHLLRSLRIDRLLFRSDSFDLTPSDANTFFFVDAAQLVPAVEIQARDALAEHRQYWRKLKRIMEQTGKLNVQLTEQINRYNVFSFNISVAKK